MALEYGDFGQDGRKGVYWIGQNGNLYIKGNGADVKDLGKYEGERDNGLYGANGGVASKYYRQVNDWNQAQRKTDPVYSDPRSGGTYDPRAAAEAKARADEIAKYREQERVATEGLGRLDRQRDIWRGNVENNYANQLNDL